MPATAIPDGFHTITPYFTVRDATRLIEFLKTAFCAEEIQRAAMPDGTIMNAQLRIGDSMVMLGEAPPYTRKFLTAMLYMYVDDVDAVYERAINAGGTTVREPADQVYGERTGAVEDFAGNQWWIAARIKDFSAEQFAQRAAQQGKR